MDKDRDDVMFTRNCSELFFENLGMSSKCLMKKPPCYNNCIDFLYLSVKHKKLAGVSLNTFAYVLGVQRSDVVSWKIYRSQPVGDGSRSKCG